MQTSTMHQPPAYRADIDGLRAVAVLLVVLEHLGFRYFGGGYVGVDVFFVISGYLIGSSMLAEFGAGTFSLIAFYERRVRRIFPALLAMLAVVSLFAYRYLLPRALLSYSQSLLAALLSFSNFFFWGQAGYFDTQSASKPLLHTWSLAVEEQFYLFFPLVLYVLFRWFPQRLRSILWSLCALSLLAACWIMRSSPPTAFFWSPLRAWELLAGVMISQHNFAPFRMNWLRELAATAGLGLVLYAGLFYTSQTAFPGSTAIAPCLGAVLILAAGQANASAVARLLAFPPLRFIGLISYSLYLWHWPLLVFQNTCMLFSVPNASIRSTKLILLTLSLLLATLSWWLVETPFRKGRWRPSRGPLFTATGVLAMLIAAFSLWVVRAQGMDWRFPADIRRVAALNAYDLRAPWRLGQCFLAPGQSFSRDFKPAECLDSVPGKKTYLVYGDSLAAHLYPGLTRVFPEPHFQLAAASACRPYASAEVPDSAYQQNCASLWRYIHTTYLQQQHPDAVIIAAGWAELNVGSPDLQKIGLEIEAFQKRGISVILLGPELLFDQDVPQVLASEIQRRVPPSLRAQETSQHLVKGPRMLDATMAQMARDRWHVRYISYSQELCGRSHTGWETAEGCPLILNTGEPLILDTHHFTLSGSTFFATRLREDRLLP